MREIIKVVVVVLMTVCVSPALAQDAAPTEIGSELRGINEQTSRAVALLEQLLGHRSEELELRRLQVAVLALQLRSGAIGDIQERIQTLQDRASEAREFSSHLDSEQQRIDDMMASDTITDEERTQLESSRDQVSRQIELSQQRLWTLEKQILDLENDLAAKRRDVDELEDIVMKGLSEF